jgi:hypothetical protein
MLRFSRSAIFRSALFVAGDTRMFRNSVLFALIIHLPHIATRSALQARCTLVMFKCQLAAFGTCAFSEAPIAHATPHRNPDSQLVVLLIDRHERLIVPNFEDSLAGS